jgi:hypothetical protein
MPKDKDNDGFPDRFTPTITKKVTKYITTPENTPKAQDPEGKAAYDAVKKAFSGLGVNVAANARFVFMSLADAQRILTMLGAFDDKNPPKEGSTLRLITKNDEKDTETDEK